MRRAFVILIVAFVATVSAHAADPNKVLRTVFPVAETGFDPAGVPDPLHPDNLLKASGRGIFLIRSFMDELRLQPAAEGGMEVVMVKRAAAAQPPA